MALNPENKVSTTIERRALFPVFLFSAVALVHSAYESTGSVVRKNALAGTADQLTTEAILMAQHNEFKKVLAGNGYDIYAYGPWHTIQQLGLIHALAAANTQPWVTEENVQNTEDSLKVLNSALVSKEAPDYDREMRIDGIATALNALTSYAANNLSHDYLDIEGSNLPTKAKINRRTFLNKFAAFTLIMNFFGTGSALATPFRYHMKDHDGYRHIPPAVLDAINDPDGYSELMAFYNSSLMLLPPDGYPKLMPEETYDEKITRELVANQEKWNNQPERRTEIGERLIKVQNAKYGHYMERFLTLQGFVQSVFPQITVAKPTDAILTSQSRYNTSITNVGVGLRLFNAVAR